MSAQNAIQLATAIQTKVGSSLISSQNLLPRGEAAGTMVQAGASSLGVFLLRDLYDMQQRTYECVEKVASILQSQLDLAEDRERRERDQAAELDKERRRLKGTGPSAIVEGTGAAAINENLDDIEESINKGRFADLLGTGLTAALLTPQFLKNVGTSLGKKLLKGTMYAAIAGFIADPIINYVENEFDLELDADAKKQLKLGMIGAGVGFGVAGIPGAIVGATVPMMAKVAQYITGNLNADELDDSDFAGTAIGGAAAAMFATGKLGAYIKGGGLAAFGAKTTFGAALMSLPVIIGVGSAVALGVGAMFIAKKIDEYQEMALNKLAETTAKLDREMGEWAAREEEGLFERFGVNLGQLSALGEAKVATQEAMEQMGQNKEKFMSDAGMQTKLISLADTIAGYSDDAIKTILLDKTKANNFFDTIESIKGIAAQGGFGEASQDVFTKMAAFSDNVQRVAKAQVAIGETGGVTKLVADNTFGRGGDKIEVAASLQPKVEELLKKQAEAQEILRLATLAREAEDEEQRAKTLGTLRDVFQIQDTDLEKAERKAKRDLQSITSQLNKANDTLQGLGVNFTFDQLKETFAGNEKGLQELIMRSVTGQGADFLAAQQEANKKSPAGSDVNFVSQGNNSGNQQINNASQNNYVGKLSVTGDDYYMKEAYGGPPR